MFREYLVQIRLAGSSVMAGIAAEYTDVVPKKIGWTIAATLLFFATLSYIWGDPVRGPFYGMVNIHAKNQFNFHAGVTRVFPIHDLINGIDFSQHIVIGDSKPISLKVSNTWWNGWKYTASLRLTLQQTVLITNNTIEGIPLGWDFNSDENSIEIVNPDGMPVFQIIHSSDYDIYVNAIVPSTSADYTTYPLMNDDGLLVT